MKSAPESPSAILQTPQVENTAAPERDDGAEATNAAEAREDREKLRTIDDAISRCRELLRNPLFNDRTRRDYDKMFHELREERRVEWMRDNVGYLIDTIGKAESYKQRFANDLNKAVAQNWISRESMSRWWDRFNDPNVLEYERKAWLEKEFPAMLKNWQETAEKRTAVEKLARERGLTAKDIPELADIFNVKGLLSQHYLSRKNKIDKAMALVQAHKKDKKTFLRFIEKELDDAVSAGWMHGSKVGAWMERVMNSDDPEAFASKVLHPFLKNWKEARADFDRLNKALDRQGVPRGFRPVNEDDFLLMDYKQRTSYCALAWIRLEDAEESDRKLASAKLRIRHNLDTKDWEGAEEDIGRALGEWPDNRELHSMKTFLDSHRPKEESAEKKERPDPDGILRNLRSMFSSIQGELHPMYVEAALAGPKVFNRFLQISYNRVWVHENGYADPSTEIVNARDEFNQAMTEQYMKHGHSNGIEHNIVDGATAAEEAIRYESKKPQMLYVGTLGRNAVMEAVKDNADNEDFGYGTSLVPKNTHYDIQARIVKNLHYPMKSALRQLDAMGYRFTPAGGLRRKGTEGAAEDN